MTYICQLSVTSGRPGAPWGEVPCSEAQWWQLGFKPTISSPSAWGECLCSHSSVCSHSPMFPKSYVPTSTPCPPSMLARFFKSLACTTASLDLIYSFFQFRPHHTLSLEPLLAHTHLLLCCCTLPLFITAFHAQIGSFIFCICCYLLSLTKIFFFIIMEYIYFYGIV